MVTAAGGLSLSRDGVPVTREAPAVVEVRVVQALSVPTQIELQLAGEHAATGGPEDWLGSVLTAAVGDRQQPLFQGDITAAEVAYGARGQRTLRLRGYDCLHRLAKRQPVRSHVNVTFYRLCTRRSLPSETSLVLINIISRTCASRLNILLL